MIPVVLCGGAGTRLWPVSRTQLPKQFLPMVSDRSMFQDTVLRASRLPQVSSSVIVCRDEHRFLVAEQLHAAGLERGRILLEPLQRNTAPALAAAAVAIEAQEANAIMLVLPADHLIRDEAAFAAAAAAAATAAAAGYLVTFGIVPDRPETGYGYIERAGEMPPGGCFHVSRFVEKPDLRTATSLVASGLLWNSGMFVMSAKRYLEELGRLRPDILKAAQAAWLARVEDLDFSRLDAAAFGACPAESIDYAVMERTGKAAVVPVNMGWSDVGSWASLWETSAKDDAGNALRGDVDLHDTRNSYVRADSRLVSVSGLDDVIVVETGDAVLVTHRDNAQSVKEAVARLAHARRAEHLSHRRVYRPWGYYEGLDEGEHYQVKRLMVKPGEALSLQLHHRRAEHWVIVSGTARVTCGDTVRELTKNESTYIPLGVKHRLENIGQTPLLVIEVQSGDYLGEDDIVRFEDRYNR